MEGHIWSIVAKRMKGNHTCWSKAGANSMAKLLAKKFEWKLGEVAWKMEPRVFNEEAAGEILDDILSAAKAPRKERKGYEYPWTGSVVAVRGAVRGDAVKAFRMAGY